MNCSAISKTSLLLFVYLSFLFGCKNSKVISGSQSEIQGAPKILFINYNIEKTPNGKRTIQFINKKIVEGKLKPISLESIQNGTIGDLIFTEFDKKSKTINQILIKNPLLKTVEYVDESKSFKTKSIKLDKTHFSLRLQLKSNTKYITISNFAKNDTLIKTQIN